MDRAGHDSTSSVLVNFTLPLAAKLARSGQFSAAIEMLDSCDDQTAGVRLLRGRIRAQAGEIDGARHEFQSVLSDDPNSGEAAAAIAALDVDRGQRLVKRHWVWPLSLAMLVAAIAIVFLTIDSGPQLEPAAESATASAIQELSERIAALETRLQPPTQTAVSSTGANTSPDRILAFAGVHHLVRVDPRYAAVECTPVFPEQGTMVIQCSGSVVSQWVNDRMRTEIGAQSPASTLDLSAVTVAGRYYVQKDDTLGHVAYFAYGDASKWQVIWQSNRDRLSTPDILIPRTELIIP